VLALVLPPFAVHGGWLRAADWLAGAVLAGLALVAAAQLAGCWPSRRSRARGAEAAAAWERWTQRRVSGTEMEVCNRDLLLLVSTAVASALAVMMAALASYNAGGDAAVSDGGWTALLPGLPQAQQLQCLFWLLGWSAALVSAGMVLAGRQYAACRPLALPCILLLLTCITAGRVSSWRQLGALAAVVGLRCLPASRLAPWWHLVLLAADLLAVVLGAASQGGGLLLLAVLEELLLLGSL
jgi:hypothetical protein